jgi:hypothetical protein
MLNEFVQLIKALAAKCHAVILSRGSRKDEEKEGTEVDDGALFQATYKELSKWEDLEKSDTNWELVVHKNNQASRSVYCVCFIED